MPTTATLNRDPAITALCPPRRVSDDRLYAEWVLHVADTLPERDAYYLKTDLDGWDAWKAEAANVAAWLAG